MMPASIRVGYRDYVVEAWAPAQASSAERYAECDRLNSVIRVRSDLPQQFAAEILLHEVLHAAYDMGDLETSNEEKIVAVFAKQLMQIFRDNPDLITYLNGANGNG